MIIIIKQVVKIGGSLFPDHAIDLAKRLENTSSVIILGGGEFANLIRKYDSQINFSDEANHWAATRSNQQGLPIQLRRLKKSRMMVSPQYLPFRTF